MNRSLLPFAALAAVLLLAGCGWIRDFDASLPESVRLGRLEPGLTQEQVGHLAGRPDVKSRHLVTGGERWIYVVRRAPRRFAEYEVAFDARGVATDVMVFTDG